MGGLRIISLFALASSLAFSATSDKPNIILVMTDDQGYGDLGVHGNDQIETPNLDRFANDSLGMERFYVNPLCAPTRASLMTGRYYLRTGILHTSRGAAKMHGDEVTIAELLKNSGYRTGLFGKWHLGDNYPMRPQDQGFEETLIHKSGGIGQTPDTDANYFNPILWRNGNVVKGDGYCTDLFFGAAIQFLRSDSEKPFFVYIAPNVPHTPLDIARAYSQPFLDRGLDSRTAAIYGMLKNLDDNFGALLQAIDEEGLDEETLIIFMTDNGPTRGRYNAGLRGAKGSVYEGGIRVPFYVRWPSQIEAGRSIDRIAAHFDVLPSLLEVAGISIPSYLTIDGRSLWPLWSDHGASNDWPDRILITQHIKSIAQAPYQNATAISQRYKLIAYPNAANDVNFQPNYSDLDVALYDLIADKGESEDVSESHPEVMAHLQKVYENWFTEMEETREFQPGVIHLGTGKENPVLLCRYQDGHRRFGTDAESVGWPVLIEETGVYRITVRDSKELKSNGKALVASWNGKIEKLQSQASIRFMEIELSAGKGMFDVWLEDVTGNTLPKDFDVLVERTDL